MDTDVVATGWSTESAGPLPDLGVDDPESLVHSYEHLPRVMPTASSSMGSDTTTTVETNALTVSGFLGAVANLCSATLGAGILALPFAMYEAGLVFGLLLLIISAWATAASIDLIVQACHHYKLGTYESVVEKSLGSKWRQTVEISILLFCGGTAVGYVIAVGDIMERVNDMGTKGQKRLAMTLVWLLAMLPLSCLRRMQSLQCASSIGIMSIGTLLVAATVHLFMPEDSLETAESNFLGMRDLELFIWPHHGLISILRACPIFFFAYSCQVNVAQIFDELPSQRVGEGQDATNVGRNIRVGFMRHATWVAIGLCTLLYGSISLVTLIDFGDGLLPNVLSCYRLSGRESALLHVAFLAMAVAVIMAFPLNVFPARLSIIQIWEAASSKRNGRIVLGVNEDEALEPLIVQDAQNPSGTGYGSDEEASSPRSSGQDEDPLRSAGDHPTPAISLALDVEGTDPFPVRQHQLVTLLVAGSALGLALVVPNISVVFGLLGGTTSSLLGFVVPGLLGLAMEGGSSSKTTSWVLVVAGTVIGVVTTVVTIYSAMHW